MFFFNEFFLLICILFKFLHIFYHSFYLERIYYIENYDDSFLFFRLMIKICSTTMISTSKFFNIDIKLLSTSKCFQYHFSSISKFINDKLYSRTLLSAMIFFTKCTFLRFYINSFFRIDRTILRFSLITCVKVNRNKKCKNKIIQIFINKIFHCEILFCQKIIRYFRKEFLSYQSLNMNNCSQIYFKNFEFSKFLK